MTKDQRDRANALVGGGVEPRDAESLVLAEQEAPAEYHYCGRCRDNASFVRGDDGAWESECCGWPPVPVDTPAYMEVI